jgi:aspartyl protease family protein
MLRIVLGMIVLSASATQAADANLVGLFPGKALLEINKTKAQIVSVGQTVSGVKLISADSQQAEVEIDGRREILRLGQSVAVTAATTQKPRTILTADGRGHFITTGSINGASTRFLIDTGASQVSMSSAEAKRLGISYLAGARGFNTTANGLVPVYRVMLDKVQVGDITLNQVECAVIEGDTLSITLLGMSFLRRLEMRREGTTLTLIKSY